MAGTSPSKVDTDDKVAFQGSNGNLWIWPNNDNDEGQAMMAGTSPSLNRDFDVAVQGSNGHLTVRLGDTFTDTGQEMAPGTSPSIDADGVVVFQDRRN